MSLKTAVRAVLNRAGIDIVPLRRSPRSTLLGLASLDVGTVIDVGANKGQFAREISRTFPRARLFCFEPLAEPFAALSAWAATQDGRVRCFNVALGDAAGDVHMHQHDEHSASSSLLETTDTCHAIYPQTRAEHLTMIRVETLDEVLNRVIDEVPRDILLKLDVQGFEDRVLRGGPKVLACCRAVVLEVAVAPLYAAQADFPTLVAILRSAGLSYAGNLEQTYGDDGRVVFLDAVFLRAQA
jgi:FkbM family methyltransferase